MCPGIFYLINLMWHQSVTYISEIYCHTMGCIGTSPMDQFSTMTPSSIAESSDEPLKMMVYYFGNEFPDGDINDIFRRLHNHSKTKQHLLVANFIEVATFVIREEVRSLPANLRVLFPPFETVFGLADNADLRNGPLGDCVNGMLLCVVQLATFIG